MTKRIRVLLADDHPMFLDGVGNALSVFEDIVLVAQCTDGAAVLDCINTLPVDVAVLDINMPSLNGIALAKNIKKDFSHIKVVFLTMYHPSALGNDGANASAAMGYVLKNSGSQVLYAAIQSAFKGERYLDPKLKETVSGVNELLPDSVKLSRREKEIIKLVGEGKGNKEIADTLFLSELTIKTHRKNIYQKLGVNNVAALMVRMRRLDLD